jgi:hypothetical protein
LPHIVTDVTPNISAPDARGTACYLYAISDDVSDQATADTPAIDPSFPLERMRYRTLQAVVSPVRLDEFGQDAINDHLNDRQWIEEKIRAHDRVIKRVSEAATTIPCRFCTVLRDQRDVTLLLSTHYDRILDTLANLRGRREWGVRALFHSDIKPADEPPAPPAENTGKQFLQRRKRQDSLRAQMKNEAQDRAHECHKALAEIAAGATLLTPHRAGKRQAVELLNAAYLVPEAKTDQFHQSLLRLQERHAPNGLELLVTGPWPPYNFVQLDLSLEAAA